MTGTASRELRQTQSSISAMMLGLVLLVCVGGDVLARNRGLELWSTALSSAFAARNNTVFSSTGNFIDFEERVLLDEIPRADYSKSGAYFFGSSNTKWAFTTWDLPAEEREHLGNYGIGASNHKDQLEFIRYLIEHHGFLQAGERGLVVLGASFHLAHADGPAGGYWAALLRRRGLYDVTQDGQIAPTAMNPVARWLRVEQARSSGFIWNMGRLAQAWIKSRVRSPHPIVHDAAQYQRGWREFMGPHWQQNMDLSMESLRQTIALVRSRGARIELVMLPQGSWMQELPFGTRYADMVRAVCEETGTPILDLSHSLPDDDFVDSNHLTVKGQDRFRSILMKSVLNSPS